MIQYQMTVPEAVHVNGIAQTQQVILGNIHVYKYIK